MCSVSCVCYVTSCTYFWFAGINFESPSGIFFQVSPKEVVYKSKGKLLVLPVVLSNRI